MKKWMERSVPRRLLSLAVCVAMVLSLLPVFAFAEGNDGLCEHHPAHTPECGYVAAVEGQDCTHVCGDDCFTLTMACTHAHGAECYGDGVLPAEGEEKTADACTHVCSEESGCVTKTHACVHTAHDETCSYVQAVAGQPCGFVCGLCTAEGFEEDTCPHGGDLASCETCASDAKVASVQALIDALPEDVTAETREAAASALGAVEETKSALSETEQAKLDLTRYHALREKLAALEPAGDKVITAWQWIDEEELLDEETGGLALPGASEKMPAYFANVVTFLPYEITATVDGVEETLSVDWVCDDYPESGAYEGEYIFTALLPQGYVLAEGVDALTVNVLLGGGETYATVSQIPYLTFDKWKGELVSTQCSSATLVTSEDTKWTSGWYVARGDVAINSRVEINGDVNLILEDGCSLTVNGGIHVFGSNALYIYAQSEGSSMGRLTAECTQNNGSGIGGNKAEEVGTIYIDGGNITAKGHIGGAGIGAGGSSNGTGSTDGVIRICGGIVDATGGYQAAGIGGGPDGSGGQISIFGGTVIAHNGDMAACIGDGTGYGTKGGCKIYIIGDATVIADATGRGTGVGTYNKQISETFTCGASSTGVAPVIITSGSSYSISDTGNGYYWRGLIFQGGNGTIYGMYSFTLRKDLTIPSISGGRTLNVEAGRTLTIDSGKTLTIPSGVTLAVNGTLTVNGNLVIENGGKLTLNGNMTVANGGSLTLNGTLTNTGSLVFQSGASVSGTGTYTGSDTSPSLQGAVVLQGKYLHIHKLVNDRCACGYSEYIFVTVSGIKAVNKVYDGTVNATLDYSGVSLRGAKAGDKVSVTATGTFTNKNVGTNKTVTITNLTLTGADAGKYRLETTGQQTTATASITQKPVTATITPNGGTYDGTITPATAVLNGVVSGDTVPVTLTYTGTANDGTVYNSTAVPTKAGTYTVTATISDSNYTLAASTATFVIQKVTVKTPDDVSKTYNGQTQTSGITDTKYYAVNSTSGKDAGTYNVSLELKDPDNCQWDEMGGKLTFTIEKATNGWIDQPQATSWTYGDNPSIDTVSAKAGTVKIEYSTDGGQTYSQTVPTDAGAYKVRFTVTDKNYLDLVAVKDITIDKRYLTITWGSTTSFPYDGENHQPTAEVGNVVSGDSITLVVSGAQKNVGDYTATVTGFTAGEGTKAGNYILPSANLSTPFSIQAKALTVNVRVKDKQYDGLNTATIDGTPTLVGVIGSDDVTLVNGTPTFKTVSVGNGIEIEFTDGFSLEGTASGNYTLTQPTAVTASITAKPILDSDITVTLDQISFAYDGTDKSPQVTVKFGTTTLVEDTDYTLSGNTATNVDTYTLTVTGKGNYSGTTTKDWKITKASITPVVTIANTVYGGPLNPSVSGNPGSGDVTYTYYSDAACTTEVTPKDVDTYYVKATVAQTDNYQSGTSEAVSFRITKKDLTVTAKDHAITYGEAPGNNGVTYDGFVNGETESVLGGTLDYEYSYSQYGDVGSSYTITPKGLTSNNYAISFVPGKLMVQQKEIGITWGNTQFTYSGSEQKPTATPTGMVNNDAITLTVSGAQTNAGSDYTATVTAIEGAKAGNYALPQSVTTTFSIAQKEVTITGTTVAESKVYDGKDTATITSDGTLSANFDGDNLTIVRGSAAYDSKTVGKNKTVTFSGFALGGSAKDNYVLTDQPASVTADITAKPVTLAITVGDKEFDGTTDGVSFVTKLTEENAFVEGDKVEVVNGEAEFAQSAPGNGIAVTFTTFSLTGDDAGNYSITNPQPENVTGNIKPSSRYLDLDGNTAFDNQTEVWVDGVAYPVKTVNGTYVALPEDGDLLTVYTYQKNTSDLTHDNYPTGMAVYRITRTENGATVENISAFSDLLQYSGSSIRITGKRGIRMITSLTKGNKSALTSSGLAGYTLEEYGTVVQWADDLHGASLTLANGKSNYAYKKGVADPVFNTTGDLTQYTNVLVWESLTDTQLGQDIVMRPYIKLSKDGETVTLYGGTVSRSIGYIAYQNRTVFSPGTAAYKYVWDIIHAVYGTQYDSDYKG